MHHNNRNDAELQKILPSNNEIGEEQDSEEEDQKGCFGKFKTCLTELALGKDTSKDLTMCGNVDNLINSKIMDLFVMLDETNDRFLNHSNIKTFHRWIKEEILEEIDQTKQQNKDGNDVSKQKDNNEQEDKKNEIVLTIKGVSYKIKQQIIDEYERTFYNDFLANEITECKSKFEKIKQFIQYRLDKKKYLQKTNNKRPDGTKEFFESENGKFIKLFLKDEKDFLKSNFLDDEGNIQKEFNEKQLIEKLRQAYLLKRKTEVNDLLKEKIEMFENDLKEVCQRPNKVEKQIDFDSFKVAFLNSNCHEEIDLLRDITYDKSLKSFWKKVCTRNSKFYNYRCSPCQLVRNLVRQYLRLGQMRAKADAADKKLQIEFLKYQDLKVKNEGNMPFLRKTINDTLNLTNMPPRNSLCINDNTLQKENEEKLQQLLNKNVKKIKMESRKAENDEKGKMSSFVKFELKKFFAFSTKFWSILQESTPILADINLLYEIYWSSMEERNLYNPLIAENPGNNHHLSYKFTVITLLICIASTFLIAYSSLITMMLDNRTYESAIVDKTPFYNRCKNLVVLTFFGPIIFVLLYLIELAENALILPFYLVTLGNLGEQIERLSKFIRESVSSLSLYQIQEIQKQRRVSQLYFQTVPILLLQLMWELKVVNIDDLKEGSPKIQEKLQKAALFSLITSATKVILSIIDIYYTSMFFEEWPSVHQLHRITANRKWIPFIHKIKERKIERSIDYGNLDLPLPLYLSNITGIFQNVKFQFTDTSLLYLSNELTLYREDKIKGQKSKQESHVQRTIDIGSSLDRVSLVNVLHFVHNFPHDLLTLKLSGIDWEELLNNSIRMGHIKGKSKEEEIKSDLIRFSCFKQKNQQQKKETDQKLKNMNQEAHTPSNENILFVCVNNEPENQSQEWLLQDCFLYLLRRQFFKMNFRLRSGENLLQYAIKHKKSRSIDILLKFNFDLQAEDDNSQMPLGQALVNDDAVAVHKLLKTIDLGTYQKYELEQNIKDFQSQIVYIQELKDEKDKNFGKLSLMAYFCWKNQDISKQMSDADTMLYLKLVELYTRNKGNQKSSAKDYLEEYNQELFKGFVKMFGLTYNQEKAPTFQKAMNRFQKLWTLRKFQDKSLYEYAQDKKNFAQYFTETYQIKDSKNNQGGSKLNFQELTMIHLLKWSNLNQEKFDLREKNIFHEKVEAQINEEKFKENLNQFISDPENTNKYQRLVEYLEMFVNKEHKFHKDQEGAVRNWLFFVFKKSSKKTKNFKNLIFDRLTEDQQKRIKDQHLEEAKKLSSAEEMENVFKNYNFKNFKEKKDKIQEKKLDKSDIQEENQQQELEDNKESCEKSEAYYVKIVDFPKKDAQIINQNEWIDEDLQIERKNVVEQDDKVHKKFEDETKISIERLFNYMIETISTVDFITDLIIIKNFMYSQHNMWFAINSYALLSPFFVCIVPFTSFQIERLSAIFFKEDKLVEFEIQEKNEKQKDKDNKHEQAEQKDNYSNNQKSKGLNPNTQKQEVQSMTAANNQIKEVEEKIEISDSNYMEIEASIQQKDDFEDTYKDQAAPEIIKGDQTEQNLTSEQTSNHKKQFYYKSFKKKEVQEDQKEEDKAKNQDRDNKCFSRKLKGGWTKRLIAYFTITPFILLVFICMDLYYLLTQVILIPFLKILGYLIGSKKQSFDRAIYQIDISFQRIFGMSDLDVTGFRRLRTISRLTFESMIQIFLNIRIILYPSIMEDLGLQLKPLIISIGFSLLHAFCELLVMAIESKAFKTNIQHYAIICFNGRFGWVPFSHILMDTSSESKDATKYIDFDDISQNDEKKGWFSIKFHFSNDTISSLSRIISNRPIIKDKSQRITLRVGLSAHKVELQHFKNFLQVAQNRVNLEIDTLDIDRMLDISDDYYENFKKETKIEDGEYIIHKISEIGFYQLVEKLIVDLQYKYDEETDENKTIVDIAINQVDGNLLKVLMRLHRQSKTYDQINKEKNDKKDSGFNTSQDLEMGNQMSKMVLNSLNEQNKSVSPDVEEKTGQNTLDGLQDFVCKELTKVDKINGRSLGNKALATLDLNIIYAFALNEKIPLNHMAQVGLLKEARKRLLQLKKSQRNKGKQNNQNDKGQNTHLSNEGREDIQLTKEKLDTQDADKSQMKNDQNSTEQEQDAELTQKKIYSILCMVFGPKENVIGVIQKEDEDILNDYFRLFPEEVHFQLNEEQSEQNVYFSIKTYVVFKFSLLRRICYENWTDKQGYLQEEFVNYYGQKNNPIILNNSKILYRKDKQKYNDKYFQIAQMENDFEKKDIEHLKKLINLLNANYKGQVTKQEVMIFDQLVKSLGLDKDQQTYYRHSRQYCRENFKCLQIEINGDMMRRSHFNKKNQSMTQENLNDKFNQDRAKNLAVAEILKFKAPEEALFIHDIEIDAVIRNKSYENEANCFLGIDYIFKNYAQHRKIIKIDRANNSKLLYDKADKDKNEEKLIQAEGKPFDDLFSSFSTTKEIRFTVEGKCEEYMRFLVDKFKVSFYLIFTEQNYNDKEQYLEEKKNKIEEYLKDLDLNKQRTIFQNLGEKFQKDKPISDQIDSYVLNYEDGPFIETKYNSTWTFDDESRLPERMYFDDISFDFDPQTQSRKFKGTIEFLNQKTWRNGCQKLEFELQFDKNYQYIEKLETKNIKLNSQENQLLKIEQENQSASQKKEQTKNYNDTKIVDKHELNDATKGNNDEMITNDNETLNQGYQQDQDKLVLKRTNTQANYKYFDLFEDDFDNEMNSNEISETKIQDQNSGSKKQLTKDVLKHSKTLKK